MSLFLINQTGLTIFFWHKPSEIFVKMSQAKKASFKPLQNNKALLTIYLIAKMFFLSVPKNGVNHHPEENHLTS